MSSYTDETSDDDAGTPAEQVLGLREAQQRVLEHLKARGRYRHAVRVAR